MNFHEHVVGEFHADLMVDEQLILEIKAVERFALVHETQLINYLKTSKIRVGLLLNFGPHPEFKRRIF